ncbi:MAG TPA: molybdopterin-guanine dinucleotide biosynthesis protein B, partial [Candidatus Bathyarchaeia archaeon]|nr:molybdopterin-guanine dinucleotide biosynthesis protein B [Candidatus Bathyarchaeia archaeon]
MSEKITPLVVAVVGTSGSGKTATIEYLTYNLTKLGFQVGVAKHIHREGFTIDTEGKDTWKHAKAGARIVIGASPNELAIIKKTTRETPFKDIHKILDAEQLDIALLEGFSSATSERTNLLKIVAAKNASDLSFILSKTRAPILAITGRVSRTASRIKKVRAPIFDIHREGPLLTTMIRRLLRPQELQNLLSEASQRHGGTCIGLAIGIRAAYIASSVFGPNAPIPNKITCGTKHCIGEAFKTIYPKSQVDVLKIRNNRIKLNSTQGELIIQLAPRKFTGTNQALTVPDSELID